MVILLLISAGVYYLFVYKKTPAKNYQPKPGSCLILEEKYCGKGKFLPDPINSNNVAVGFKLPNGTTVFSPEGGDYSTLISVLKNKPDEKISSAILIKSLKGDQIYYYRLMINLNKDEMWKDKKVSKGDVLTVVNDIKKIDFFGDYNLVFTLGGYDNSKKEIISTSVKVKEIFNLIKK